MSQTDPIAELLTRIRNAMRARYNELTIPHSRLREAICRVLMDEGFLGGVEVGGEIPKKVLALKLDGNVGCMVNGAGLAMATMDIIKYAGGMPANFLDVGGGANAEQVTHAFEILLSDKNVKAVLINIFGGILRVDTLARGVVEAATKANIKLPIVLRLEGTNVEQGREILKESGLNFIVAQTMKDAAEKVVAAAASAN